MNSPEERPQASHPGETGPSSPIERDDVGRRNFVLSATMATGLAASYGTLLTMAGRFLYPSSSSQSWVCVGPAGEIPAGGSLAFRSPAGLPVVVTRKEESADKDDLTGDDFRALSSVCPHLGCRVHWEPHNDRFFCPCHNGAFDAEGNPTAGPPLADNQPLPNYPLRVEDGVLFIEVPVERIKRPQPVRIARSACGPRQDGPGVVGGEQAENV